MNKRTDNISMNMIEDLIGSRQPGIIGLQNAYKGAVCIPLIEGTEGLNVLFEVRSQHVAGQPGDVCFPGGGIEPGEEPEKAAVRECCEELLIDESSIRIIGEFDRMHSDNIMIYPFAAEISGYEGTFSECEVQQVFQVPLRFFLENEPERYRVNAVVEPEEGFPYERIQGGRNYKWRRRTGDQLFYEYDGITIWGMTARIIHAFAETIKEGIG